MERICVQLVLLSQSMFQIVNLLIHRKYRFICIKYCNETERLAFGFETCQPAFLCVTINEKLKFENMCDYSQVCYTLLINCEL